MLDYNEKLAVLVGSRIYDINLDDSDYDWVVFGTDKTGIQRDYIQYQDSKLVQNKPGIKDIKYFEFDCIPKRLWESSPRNINYLWTTDYVVTDDTKEFWNELHSMREDIALMNLSRYRELMFCYIHQLEDIVRNQSYCSNNKYLSLLIYMKNLLKRFSTGMLYEEALKQNTEELLNIRKGIYSEKEAIQILNSIDLNTRELVLFYRKPSNYTTKNKVEDLVNSYLSTVRW